MPTVMPTLPRPPHSARLLLLALCAATVAACATGTIPGDDPDGGPPPDLTPAAPACVAVPLDVQDCPVTVRYAPKGAPSKVTIAGEWNQFDKLAQPLQSDGKGAFQIQLRLRPGTYAYKLVVDEVWQLDPGQSYRKYSGGVENSGLRVPDCRDPILRPDGPVQITRPAAGAGTFAATIHFQPGATSQLPCRWEATLRTPQDHATTTGAFVGRSLTASELTVGPDGSAQLRLSGLADGKYTVRLSATAGDRKSEPLLLPFWIEPEPFRVEDSPLYMAMTDRFRDGDMSNNPARLPGVSQAADFRGGDLGGIEAALRDGYFDQLGVRALWLTPWQTQPPGSFIDQTGTQQVAGYHGYWPIAARKVDPRIGTFETLHRVVEEAHRHGIRVLMDAVLNHVHEDHEYLKDPAKKGWFRTAPGFCICGTAGCDWTEKRLECLFATYMPDINWSVTDASEQFISDVLWWAEEFDLDGLRIDAVKHVEDLAVWNLGTRVRERFERAGTRMYLVGETAMGWREGSIADNASEYDTIKRYIGPAGLDGQFDFVLHHAVPYRVFAYQDRAFLHTDFWTHASLTQFQGMDMVRFIGSHDSSRFITMATYRGQPGFPRDQASNKWSNLPAAPPDREPYDRLYLGLLHLFTSPGMPLLYYGDEYGEYGGGDPDNRHPMRFTGLSPLETAQKTRTQAVLQARARLRGLRRGDLKTLLVDEGPGKNIYVYARPDADPRHSALVALNLDPAANSRMVTIMQEPGLGWRDGTVLVDQLAGTEVMVTAGSVLLNIPARGGLVLSPK